MGSKRTEEGKLKIEYSKGYLTEQLECEKFEKEHWHDKYKKTNKENTKWIIATGALAILNILQVIV